MVEEVVRVVRVARDKELKVEVLKGDLDIVVVATVVDAAAFVPVGVVFSEVEPGLCLRVECQISKT